MRACPMRTTATSGVVIGIVAELYQALEHRRGLADRGAATLRVAEEQRPDHRAERRGQLHLEGGAWVLVRPSGTEAVARLYVEAPDDTSLAMLREAAEAHFFA